MYLVQILLPLHDNDGRAFERERFAAVRSELGERFGGVTAYQRAPAQGMWQEGDGRLAQDDVVVHEVMVEELDRSWWAAYRERLRREFRQEELVVRAWPLERL